MKKIVFLLITACWFGQPVFSQENIRSKKFIKEIADRVNEYQYSHFLKYSNNNWVRGARIIQE